MLVGSGVNWTKVVVVWIAWVLKYKRVVSIVARFHTRDVHVTLLVRVIAWSHKFRKFVKLPSLFCFEVYTTLMFLIVGKISKFRKFWQWFESFIDFYNRVVFGSLILLYFIIVGIYVALKMLFRLNGFNIGPLFPVLLRIIHGLKLLKALQICTHSFLTLSFVAASDVVDAPTHRQSLVIRIVQSLVACLIIALVIIQDAWKNAIFSQPRLQKAFVVLHLNLVSQVLPTLFLQLWLKSLLLYGTCILHIKVRTCGLPRHLLHLISCNVIWS